AEPGDGLTACLGFDGQGVFTDLQDQAVGGQPVVPQGGEDGGGQCGVEEVACAQPDRDGQVLAVLPPPCDLGQGDVEDLPGEGSGQVGLFHDRHELLRVEQATGGVPPADQGVQAGGATVLQAHPWLVVQYQRAPGDAAASFALRAESGGVVAALAPAGCSDPRAGVAAQPHGHVGAFQRECEVGCVVGVECDADAGFQVEVRTVDADGFGQGITQAGGHLGREGRASHLWEQ